MPKDTYFYLGRSDLKVMTQNDPEDPVSQIIVKGPKNSDGTERAYTYRRLKFNERPILRNQRQIKFDYEKRLEGWNTGPNKKTICELISQIKKHGLEVNRIIVLALSPLSYREPFWNPITKKEDTFEVDYPNDHLCMIDTIVKEFGVMPTEVIFQDPQFRDTDYKFIGEDLHHQYAKDPDAYNWMTENTCLICLGAPAAAGHAFEISKPGIFITGYFPTTRQEFPTILSDDNPTYGKDWFDPPSKWYQDNIWAFFEDKNLVHLDMPPMNHTQTWGDEKDPETWRQTTRPTMPVHLYYVKKKG